MNRPNGLTLTTILMAACNALGWLVIDYRAAHVIGTFIAFTFLIVIGYLVLWAYWRGQNWARILVLLTSVLTVFNLRSWNASASVLKTPNRIMLTSEFILGIFLLFWLNTPSVRAFFKRNRGA